MVVVVVVVVCVCVRALACVCGGVATGREVGGSEGVEASCMHMRGVRRVGV